jgi:hypothetical protein
LDVREGTSLGPLIGTDAACAAGSRGFNLTAGENHDTNVWTFQEERDDQHSFYVLKKDNEYGASQENHDETDRAV